jgi:hypothetical protein
MAGITQLIEGAAMVAGGVAIDYFTGGAGAPIGNMLIAAGAGQVISGVGSMIEGGPKVSGLATTTRESAAPWPVIVGQARVGGKLIYRNVWGSNNQMLDMVILLAHHPCDAVDELLFDQQRVQIDTGAIPTSAAAGYSIATPCANSGTSFSPLNPSIDISHIARVNDVVTVTLKNTNPNGADIPYLQAGDRINIRGITGDYTLNGTFQVAQIISRVAGVLTFTYLSGGLASIVDNEGQARPTWPDYGRDVYVEYLLGNQTLGQTFVGMTAGTPWQGTGKLCTPASPQQAGGTAVPNPWTAYCSLMGCTAAFIRLKLSSNFPSSVVPQISFHVRGKNDISDPRTSPATVGYTANAALVIADYLSNQTWGFRAAYGTEIDTAALIVAANRCDVQAPLAAGGTENSYECNGQFTLDQKRGEILQNLLTSCAGRVTYQGGLFAIQAAGWTGPGSPPVAVNLTALATAGYRWRKTVPGRELFNGAKGTYISAANGWKATDIPYYAQDTRHGYSGPVAQGGDINQAADPQQTRRWLEMHRPFVISASMAQRLAKIELLRRRGVAGSMAGLVPVAGYGGTGTFPLALAGYQFAALDVFEATAPFLNFTNKLLEVAAVRFRVDQQDQGDREVPVLGVEIDTQETDSSIYSWSVEEELTPQGYQQGNWEAGTFVETAPLPWSPGYAAPGVGDAVGGAARFGIQPVYGLDTNGDPTVAVVIKGTAPASVLDTGIARPQLTCVASDTGGTIPAGTYVVGLAARDSGGASYESTDYLSLAVVVIGGAGTGSIAVTATWGSGDDGGDLYMAQLRLDAYGGELAAGSYGMHWQRTLTSVETTASLTSFNQASAGGPDPLFDHFEIVLLKEIHGGPWAQQVQALSPGISGNAGYIRFADPAGGAGMTYEQWADYTLTLLAKIDQTAEIPVRNLAIAASGASSGGVFVVTIGPGADGNLPADVTSTLTVGDLLLMRHKATFTANSFTDPNIANEYYPNGATGVEAGHLAIVVDGIDRGDVQVVAGVTESSPGSGKFDTFNLEGDWLVTPNAGDHVVIVAPGEEDTPAASMPAQVDVPNLAGQAWLVLVRTCDANGNSGPDLQAPMAEIYFFGAQGTRTITASATGLPTDRVIDAIISAPATYDVLPFSGMPNQSFIVRNDVTSTAVLTIQLASGSGWQDTFDDGVTTSWALNPGDNKEWTVPG